MKFDHFEGHLNYQNIWQFLTWCTNIRFIKRVSCPVFPVSFLAAQIFSADLLSIKTVYGAKVRWCWRCGCDFYVVVLALSLGTAIGTQ